MDIQVKKYTLNDEETLIELIKKEGDEWRDYWDITHRENFRKALASSVVYLIFEGENLCGYIRCKTDHGFGIYIFDLLVDASYRGKGYGQILMKKICDQYPNQEIYVMSDVDAYYEKIDCKKIGTIFSVNL